jgi:Ca-activated chloride channel family protein
LTPNMPVEYSGFHFAEPWWLLALAIPAALWLWPRTRARTQASGRLKVYADAHLLPHLLVQGSIDERAGRRFGLWTLLWCLTVLAMAGPRWDYREVHLYQPGASLVILLDLSRSMNVNDVRPSRLARARQEIEDLLDLNTGARIGLIAFATVPHVVSPATDDTQTLRHLLPSLTTDLVRMGGSRLTAALDRGERLLAGQPADSVKALLLISDGDFAEPGLDEVARRLAAAGIRLHVLGVGTDAGGPVPKGNGEWLTDSRGDTIMSRLGEQQLKGLAAAGGGVYERADYRDSDTRALLKAVMRDVPVERIQRGTYRIWNERYVLPVILIMLILLPRFRRAGSAAQVSS